MRRFKQILLILTITCVTASTTGQNVKKLWYASPAKKWSAEALPIGNGRLGAMLFGGVKQEHIQFNEISLWSGENNWDGEYETGDLGFGSYRNFGDIILNFSSISDSLNYRRELDISNGVHSTTFISKKLKFSREAFASHPAQVMVFNYTADKKKSLSGKISLRSAQKANTIVGENQLSFAGEMPNKLKYAAVLQVFNDGGTVKEEGEFLRFENCNSITLLLDARTNYKPDFKANWRGEDPLPLIKKELAAAQETDYLILKKKHCEDLSALLGRVKINIGKPNPALDALPTDQRLVRYSGIKGSVEANNKNFFNTKFSSDTKKVGTGLEDTNLELLMFQYGRYLLASSSREGGLPANLQGLWNDSNEPAWASDYHNNINIQMNYWAAETTNLSECHVPLIDYIVAQSEPCRIATRKAFGEHTRGWTARTSQNIFGGNGWEWNIPASTWYAQHVYEHYAFTQDMEYLKKTAYPVIKEICEYWEDNLKKLPNGTLVVPNGWSPEHGPREDGVMHDQQLVWDLFTNFLEISKVLNIDEDFQRKVAYMQSHLAPNKIGKWGQLQEWQTDRDDPNDQHRHTSHLFGVYPGRQISLTNTPELAQAAIISLRSRSGNYGDNIDKPFTVESTVGDSRRSWTWPWRCALWARLGEGERSAIMIRGLLTYNTLPNLFCNHPPFQMDGNFGIPAAMTEMLMQSHADEIQLLPALPKAWAAKGSFSGLKARGGFTVSCSWENGKVKSYRITSARPTFVKVHINGKVKEIISGIQKL